MVDIVVRGRWQLLAQMSAPASTTAPKSARAAKRQHKPDARKRCEFECGQTNHDPDEEGPEKCMRWAYADGSGNNCWYCERLWMTELAHLHDSRAAYKDKLGTQRLSALGRASLPFGRGLQLGRKQSRLQF